MSLFPFSAVAKIVWVCTRHRRRCCITACEGFDITTFVITITTVTEGFCYYFYLVSPHHSSAYGLRCTVDRQRRFHRISRQFYRAATRPIFFVNALFDFDIYVLDRTGWTSVCVYGMRLPHPKKKNVLSKLRDTLVKFGTKGFETMHFNLRFSKNYTTNVGTISSCIRKIRTVYTVRIMNSKKLVPFYTDRAYTCIYKTPRQSSAKITRKICTKPV